MHSKPYKNKCHESALQISKEIQTCPLILNYRTVHSYVQTWHTPGGPCNWYAVTGREILSLLPQAQADSFPVGGMQKNRRTSWNFPAQALYTLGCCTTTTPHVTRQYLSMNFWQKKAFLLFLSPRIHRISVPVTYFYSPG